MFFTFKNFLFAGFLLGASLVLTSASYEPVGSYSASYEYPTTYSPYSFGYDVNDNYGNTQWRQEKSISPHEVHGSYGFRDNNGNYREVVYVADKNGFHAHIKSNEPGTEARDPADIKMDVHPVTAQSNVYQQVKSHAPAATVSYY